MKFGICYRYWNKDWEGSDYPVFIERARKCGFDGFEIFWGRTLEMSKKEVDEIVAASKANDVEIYISGGFNEEFNVAQPDEAGRKHAVERALELLKCMTALGARNFSGINYGAWCDFDAPENKQKLFEDAAKSLHIIGKACEDVGFSWNMEVVNRFETCMLNTAAEARQVAEMADSPAINILLDTFHGLIEEDDLCEAIRIAGDRLGHYHMGTNNRREPRPCVIPWQDICNTLKEIGYDRCISFEPLVNVGGTVALQGGGVWRPMMPAGITAEEMDKRIMDSLAYIKGMF